MSYQEGWAALNLDMPARVPRTEYSANKHWALVQAVTGQNIGEHTPWDEQIRVWDQFFRAWNYGLVWATLISRGEFGEWSTRMGHAVYASGGTDLNTEVRCPFKTPEEVLAFDPWEKLGPRDRAEIRGRFDEHYADCAARWTDAVSMTGIYISCMSGLIDLFGWELLLTAAGLDPEGFGEMTLRYVSWIQQYFEALAESAAPVVMIHDDIVWTSGPFISPDWYRRYVFPSYRRLFPPVLDSGKRVLFTSDGDYTKFVDDIAGCGVHGFVMEPCTDMRTIAERYGKTHVFVGNADTRILLSGTRAEIRAEVERCMAIGKSCPGFFMAVGNHIPANTPVANALYYNEVYEELSRR